MILETFLPKNGKQIIKILLFKQNYMIKTLGFKNNLDGLLQKSFKSSFSGFACITAHRHDRLADPGGEQAANFSPVLGGHVKLPDVLAGVVRLVEDQLTASVDGEQPRGGADAGMREADRHELHRAVPGIPDFQAVGVAAGDGDLGPML
jgi:hypothetical protein